MIFVDTFAFFALVDREDASPRYSFVDCVSFEMMKANGVRRFFAFDDDFQKAGFQPA